LIYVNFSFNNTIKSSFHLNSSESIKFDLIDQDLQFIAKLSLHFSTAVAQHCHYSCTSLPLPSCCKFLWYWSEICSIICCYSVQYLNFNLCVLVIVKTVVKQSTFLKEIFRCDAQQQWQYFRVFKCLFKKNFLFDFHDW
jgi:hypothetical protein